VPDIPAILVGTWEKMDEPPCAATYPFVLQIDERGFYNGRAKIPGEFVLWDDGTVRQLDPDKLAISTANDAVVTYRFRVEDDTIEFTTRDGCVFKYRRTR